MGVFDLFPDVGFGAGLAVGVAVGAVVVDQGGDAGLLELACPVVEMLFFEEGELKMRVSAVRRVGLVGQSAHAVGHDDYRSILLFW